MTNDELARHVRQAIVTALCEALELPTRERPLLEALDQYYGCGLIAQRAVELLGLVPPRVEQFRAD